jgi:hypothetical protein
VAQDLGHRSREESQAGTPVINLQCSVDNALRYGFSGFWLELGYELEPDRDSYSDRQVGASSHSNSRYSSCTKDRIDGKAIHCAMQIPILNT